MSTYSSASQSASGAQGGLKKSPDADSDSDHVANQPTKRRAHRVSRACDFCHTRSIRCKQENVRDSQGRAVAKCQSCLEYGKECTYDRPSKKRGVKSNVSRRSSASLTTTAFDNFNVALSLGIDTSSNFQAPDVLDHKHVLDVAEIYFETVYPIYPIFHRLTLIRRLQRKEYINDPRFFTSVFAMVALTLGRIRDGALFSERWNAIDLAKLPESESVAALVHTIIPKDSSAADHFDYIRAAALLAVTAIQNGNTRDMHMWIGQYHMYIRINRLKDEANWPEHLGLIEREERRRCFWSMYCVEIFSAACFDTLISCREAQNKVNFPHAIDDERLDQIAATGQRDWSSSDLEPPDPDNPAWMQGWNFTTDLYRVLEHAIDRRRDADNRMRSNTSIQLFHANRASVNPSMINPLPFFFSALLRFAMTCSWAIVY